MCLTLSQYPHRVCFDFRGGASFLALDQILIASKSLLRHGNLYSERISLPSATTLQSGEQTPVGARPSDLRVKPAGPTLPEAFAGAGGAIAETKAPGTCGVVGRGVCPATAKGRSRSIQIAGVLFSTA